ncbi:MAG: radical SAM protein, partial [Bacteroidales bacterium]
AQGVKELILIEQDLTYYGIDLYQRQALPELIQEMAKIEGLEWIRLQYLYPHAFPEELIKLIKEEPKLCKYIDIPLQHISTEVLHSMKRSTTKEESMALMTYLREQLPNAAFRTTLIVGYPNETEKDFEDLKQFVSDFRFERLGVFTYSPEEGTSAYELGDLVSDKEKQRRADEIMEIQETISLSINENKIGKEFRILLDREEDYYIGRTEFDSPEVDDEVLIAIEDGELTLGEFYQVRITEAEPHDLYAELI